MLEQATIFYIFFNSTELSYFPSSYSSHLWTFHNPSCLPNLHLKTCIDVDQNKAKMNIKIESPYEIS